jgi:hypothetical protein
VLVEFWIVAWSWWYVLLQPQLGGMGVPEELLGSWVREISEADLRSQCFLVNTGTSENAQ